MNNPLERIRGGLVVSCQTPEGSPLRGQHLMGYMARAAESAGAVGIRAQGLEDVRDIRAVTDLPIIGLIKRTAPDTPVFITPLLEDVIALAEAGADIVAVDATQRRRANGLLGHEFVALLKRESDVAILADIDTLEAALLAAEAGADAVATTLSGYTVPVTPPDPDLELLRDCAINCTVPVLAEGRFNTPALAASAIAAGAWAVCVGSAITDPYTSAGWYARAVAKALTESGEAGLG